MVASVSVQNISLLHIFPQLLEEWLDEDWEKVANEMGWRDLALKTNVFGVVGEEGQQGVW